MYTVQVRLEKMQYFYDFFIWGFFEYRNIDRWIFVKVRPTRMKSFMNNNWMILRHILDKIVNRNEIRENIWVTQKNWGQRGKMKGNVVHPLTYGSG